MELNGDTLNAIGITGLTATGTISASDLVGISQGGADRNISYAAFLDGLTIDLAQPATPVTDTDTFWVAQGTSTMLRQTFAAIWSWIATKLPSYKRPVVEITTDTTLDGTVHNGAMLICSQAVTLSPAFINMGNGFSCDIINLSDGGVTLASGITTSTGSAILLPRQYAVIRGANYTGGSVVYAGISSSAVAVPGQVTGLAANGATSSAITLSWSASTGGGVPASYTVQLRSTGTTNWITANGAVTGTTFTVTGLAASSSYDYQVYGVNAGGSGPASTIVTVSTLAAAGAVSAVTWNVAPTGSYVHASGTVGVNAHVTPASASVQFGFSTSSTVAPPGWTAGSLVNTDLWGAFVPIPTVAGSWYAWCEGSDGSSPTVYPTPFVVT
ncbi:MAG: fibronectin type III domain-containing protein [Proteobacteria bacterium]|nr:fibronectin type III domain-containing protein [Pseudomonadota bacterium]